MRLLVLYRPNSEYASAVETFVHDYQRLHEAPGKRVEVQNVDTRDGMSIMTLYDIYEHPAILVLNDDSQIIKHWTGPTLPLMDEVAGYFNQN
jgi:hypothetical protein